MRVISVIEDQGVIKTILKHLGLWLVTREPEPRAKGPPRESQIEYSDAQISPAAAYLYRDPEYSLDVWGIFPLTAVSWCVVSPAAV
ncbi:MAG: hypothetical protein ACRD99_00555 [Nitrososphaera sp.]